MRRLKAKTYGLILGVVALLCLGGLFWRLDSKAPFPSAAPDTLFLADGGSSLSALLYAAYQKTFFFTQKVNFHLSFYSSGRDALEALVSGKADLATVADVPIVESILADNDFRVIGTISTSGRSLAIVSKGRTRPDQLRGMKIGYVPGTASEYFLSEYLTKHDIKRSQVVLVPIRPEQTDELLVSGKIGAASVFDPHIVRIKNVFHNDITVSYAPDLYQLSWNLVVSKRLLANEDMLENIIRSLHVAEQYSLAHPTEAEEIMSRFLRIEKSEASQLWDTLDVRIQLSQALIISMERQAKWYLARTGISRPLPDFTNILHSKPMKAVLPQRVTVIE